jgi:hypothetical protein
VRVSVVLVDGKLWSSGTQTRLRTKHLRRDPRCTLVVFEEHGGGYLTLECNVTMIEGEAGADANVRLIEALQPESQQTGMLRLMTGKQVTRQAYRDYMIKDQRLIYEFEAKRAYGVF